METTYERGNPAMHRQGGRSGLAGFLMYYAEGHAPLWKAFWIWGVALSWVLFAVFYAVVTVTGVTWPLFIVATIIMVPYTAWILVAVWLCAFNTQNDLWGYAARFLTIVWSANIGLAAGFLMAELIL